jgi:hypothetical protein
LTPVEERLQDVLLDVMVVVDDGRHPVAKLGKVLDIFFHAVVVHVVGGRLRPQQSIIADILLGKAVPIVAANHRIGQVEIFDHRL